MFKRVNKKISSLKEVQKIESRDKGKTRKTHTRKKTHHKTKRTRSLFLCKMSL